MNMTSQVTVVLAVCLTLLATAHSVPRNGRKVDFHAGSHFRNEFKGENGFIEGEYGYRTPDGCMHVVRYEAQKSKYRVIGTSKRDCHRGIKKQPPPPKVKAEKLPLQTQKPFVLNKKTGTTTTQNSIVTFEPFTTKKQIQTNFRPITTTKRPITTTRRPVTTRKPVKNINTTTKSVKTTTTNAPLTTQTTKESVRKTATTTTTTRKPKTTTTRKPKTTTTRRPKSKPTASARQNDTAGKQLFVVDPPPNMKRPTVLSPDDPDPVYSFGFKAPDHGHTQAGLPDGTKKGEFFYDSPDGWRRFVTYTAGKNGFYPKLRRERTPGWEDSPLNPKNKKRSGDTGRGGTGGSGTDGEGGGAGGGGAGGGGAGGGGGNDGKGDGKNGNGGEEDDDAITGGKELTPPLPVSNGCPYYFYTNTKINFHWERCLLNATRVGVYGSLADDGYSHNVAYYADARGYRPKVTKTLQTAEQQKAFADFTEGAFIIPKIDEEKKETEKRIQEWITQNQNRIDNPL